MATPIPVLLDTDIGADIDDALALAYLLGEPRCDLLGVTTATGDTRKRAAMAAWLCAESGRSEIPVFAGLRGPMLGGIDQPDVSQFAALPPAAPIPQNEPWDALDFLRRTIRTRPGEVVLLAIGPLTNVATLFLADPEIPTLLKQIVLMSGTFGLTEEGQRANAEWNVQCDPAAAAIVFRMAPPGALTAVALDVTFRCQMPRADVSKSLSVGPGAARAAGAMLEHWKGDPVTFHDPLAAAVIFEPRICQYALGIVEIEFAQGPGIGRSCWNTTPAGPHRVCSDVDVAAFFETFFRTTCGDRPDV